MILLVSLALVTSSAVSAREKGPLVSLLAGYVDLKERVQEIREARKSGHASDSRMLMELFAEIIEAKQETFQFRAAQHTTGTMNKIDETTSNMIYAYEAMGQIVAAEVDRNLYLPDSDISLRLAEKYEELWKMIDSSIPSVSVPS
ncbi:MAG TPA: hypothetical protein VKP13_18660 [Nitrospira sp.]|nr:hypothetical protein [Nitrospira sp.]